MSTKSCNDVKSHLKGHGSFAEMVSTHIENWRTALEDSLMIKCGEDAEYIKHELAALDDIDHACTIELVKDVTE